MERRLAAILAADVVGYSRLMEVDEAGTLASLKSHSAALINPKIAQYHGRIVKLMGDGLLAEFPSAVEAVQCAVEIQHMMAERNADVPLDRRTTYRVGINIGDIVVEDDDIFGDGVNIAARLEGLAEPGGVCISRPVHTQIKSKLDLTFERLGEKKIKNIAEPVTVYRVVFDEKSAALVTPLTVPRSTARHRRWPQIAAGFVLTLLAITGFAWWQLWAPDVEPASVQDMAYPLPDKPSIAVLAFDNLSGDPEQEVLSDAISDSVITGLSRFPELFVIARHSSFKYKGEAADVRLIGRELGVRYVLEGGMQRAGNRLRVSTQLIDASSGDHIWAEEYDRADEDIFALQDEMIESIVTALAIKVEEAERLRATGVSKPSLNAYDLFLRARDLQQRKGFWIKEVNQEVRVLLEQAISLAPDFSRAYADLAWTHLYDFIFKWTDPPESSRQHALDLARKAVRLDPSSARAHYALGYVYLYQKEHELADAEVEKALALNPNDARLRAGAAGLNIYGGDPERAIEQITEAMRLNPHHEDWYWHFLAWARLHAGKYDEALQAIKRVVSPSAGDHRMFAAILVRLGRLEEAASHSREVLKREPDFAISHFRGNLPYKHADDADDYLEALALAGLPE